VLLLAFKTGLVEFVLDNCCSGTEQLSDPTVTVDTLLPL
jgi:hypothetical protein